MSALTERNAELQRVLDEMQSLKVKAEKDLPVVTGEKAQAVDLAQRELEECRANVEEKRAGRELRKNELAKGVSGEFSSFEASCTSY